MVHRLDPGPPDGGPVFPRRLEPDAYGQVAEGGRLDRRTLVEAYRRGIFPWSGEDPIPWFSPDPRLILIPGRFHASKSLTRLARSGRYELGFDDAFEDVMRGCATTERAGEDGTWITEGMVAAYGELHEVGIAHSVEVRSEGALVGGLYGLTFGRAFFGESMFSAVPNASKLALMHLCDRLTEWGFDFVDCQAVTRHLMSLGAEPVPRASYLARLAEALEGPSRHERWR